MKIELRKYQNTYILLFLPALFAFTYSMRNADDYVMGQVFTISSIMLTILWTLISVDYMQLKKQEMIRTSLLKAPKKLNR